MEYASPSKSLALMLASLARFSSARNSKMASQNLDVAEGIWDIIMREKERERERVREREKERERDMAYHKQRPTACFLALLLLTWVSFAQAQCSTSAPLHQLYVWQGDINNGRLYDHTHPPISDLPLEVASWPRVLTTKKCGDPPG